MSLSNGGLSFAVSVCLAGAITVLGVSDRLFASEAVASDPHAPVALPLTLPTTPDYRDIAARNAAAIVQITTTPVAHAREHFDVVTGSTAESIPPDDPYYRLYRYLPISHAGVRAVALGSGFVVSHNGVILTNAHWVRDARVVSVQLADGRTFKGEVLGVDPLTDIAVVKIDARALPTVELGEARDLAVGEQVFAMGLPQDAHMNVTSGTVRAIGRSSSLVPFIRTDFAARPDGSGGPLLDRCGRVVAVNAWIATGARGHGGVSFAIPIDVALAVASLVVPVAEIHRATAGGCQIRAGVPE